MKATVYVGSVTDIPSGIFSNAMLSKYKIYGHVV